MSQGPDIAALLAGAQGQSQTAAPAPPDAGGGPPSGGADHGQAIRDILDQVRQTAQSADDEEESLTWEKISTLIQQILAKQQKQDDELLQGKMPPSAMRRALSG